MDTHTGIDLIAARKRARVPAVAIAARMNVTKQRLHNVESAVDRPVTDEFWSRYIAALNAEVAARGGEHGRTDTRSRSPG